MLTNAKSVLTFEIGVIPSGVATGWHGWTMSRGPGAKGAPEREGKKKMKNKKRKEKEENRERNFSNTRTGAPPGISP